MTLAKDVKRGEMIKKVFDLGEVKDLSYKDDSGNEIQKLSFTITSNRRDRDRDVVNPAGAVIDDYANNPVMLWAHQYTEFPIARSVEMSRLMAPKADGSESHLINAIVEFQPDSNYHESYAGIRGSMVYKMYKTKFLNAVSIGFDPWEWEAVKEKGEGNPKTPTELLDLIGTGGTHFTKWDMLEFSAVPVPSNPDALVDRKMKKEMTKMLRTWATNTLVECERCSSTNSVQDKGAIPYAQTAKDDKAAWDGSAEVAKATPEQLRKMCAWYDSANPDVKSSYKLPHHTTTGTLIKAGLMAAGGAVQGARTPPNIPPGDMPAVKSHLAKHYKEFDMTAPWEPKSEEIYVTKEIRELENKLKELKAVQKAGRVLSSANEADLKKALEGIDQAEELIEGVLEQVTGQPYEEPGEPAEPANEPPEPKAVSYPLGHEADYMRKDLDSEVKSDDVIQVVDDGEKPDPQEIVSVDVDTLAEVMGLNAEDVETLLESLNAQGEGKTEETEE